MSSQLNFKTVDLIIVMILHSKRTIIKPIEESDIPKIIEMYQELDSFKYVKPFQGKSTEFYQNFLKARILSNKDLIGFWTVTTKNKNEFIGTVNLNQFASTRMTQLGCHLKKDLWNKGYASELLGQILEYGISNLKLNEIFGLFEDENIASKKLLERLHFKPFEIKTILETKVNVYKYSAQHRITTAMQAY